LKNNIAVVLAETGEHAEALATYERALAIFQNAFGPEHQLVGDTRTGMAKVWVLRGKPARALPLVESALAQFSKPDADPISLAWARFIGAQALWDANRDRDRARTLATQARDAFQADGAGSAEALAEAKAWLAAHP
jgi:tetratricopeptide (TPR) repeat protein